MDADAPFRHRAVAPALCRSGQRCDIHAPGPRGYRVGTKNLKTPEPQSGVGAFLERHDRTILALFVLALMVHDVFGPHGFIAMRRTQSEIDKVKKDLDR